MRLMNIDKKILSANIVSLALVVKQNIGADCVDIEGGVTTNNFCLCGTDNMAIIVHEITVSGTETEIHDLYQRKYLTLDPISFALVPKIVTDNKVNVELIIEETFSGIPGDEPIVEHIIKVGSHVACKYNAADPTNVDLTQVLYQISIVEENERIISTNQFNLLKQMITKDDIKYSQVEMNDMICDIYVINPQLFYLRRTDTPIYENSRCASLIKSFVTVPVVDDDDEEYEECTTALLEESKAIQ